MDSRTGRVMAFLVPFIGCAAVRLLPAAEVGTWVLLGLVGFAAGLVGGRPSRVWLALAGAAAAEALVDLAGGPSQGPFWYLAVAARGLVVFVLFVAGTAVRPATDRSGARRWRLAAVVVVVLTVAGLLGYVGTTFARSGEDLAQAGEGGCTTPMAHFSWAYEAINYDQADDARLLARHIVPNFCFEPAVNPDGSQEPDQGEKAGTEVVSSDGIHVAGWYIPAADGTPPSGATLVLAHGGRGNKSDMLKYALPLHHDYNLVLIDLRNEGRSTGKVSSGGLFEARDLRAMIDWLERTKHPTWLGLVGNSNGAATVLAEAVDDSRPQAIVLDSMHASVITQLGNIIETEYKPPLPAWPTAWAVVTGASLQLGGDITSVDPVRTITRVGSRPVLLLHGFEDSVDRPADALEPNVAAAIAAGVNVEVHVCPTGGHGTVIDSCPVAWAEWTTHFLAAARGGVAR